MGRKHGRARRRGRSGGAGGGGLMTSMRGGFRKAVGADGARAGGQPARGGRRLLSTLATIALIVAAALLVARRFGLFR
jgi:hypothetical protein